MSAIQPSIVARLKPELDEYKYDHFRRQWLPREYKDQILDLLPYEDANVGDIAESGGVITEVVERKDHIQKYAKATFRTIRVQFYHKTEV